MSEVSATAEIAATALAKPEFDARMMNIKS
jgi:hypothetical protein